MNLESSLPTLTERRGRRLIPDLGRLRAPPARSRCLPIVVATDGNRMNRRDTVCTLVALGASALALPLRAYPQASATRMPRMGFLGTSSAGNLTMLIEALRQGLRELGRIEGQTIAIDYRYAEGHPERLAGLAAELVQLKVDVIVTEGTSATQAARNASTLVPIVMALVGDPVGSKLIQSLARPGSNITGVTGLSYDLIGKQLELLKEIVPGLKRLAALWNPANSSHLAAMKEFGTAARALRLELRLMEAQDANELDTALSQLAATRPDALIAASDPTFDSHQKRIAEFTTKNRLPSVYTKTAFAEAGGLISYGARYPDLFRRAAAYVDKILKGAKPADLPVEQPTKFECVINLKTAKALGLKIPQSVLIRADRVIE
ncbi:MAG: ABC transporter substrate-binding protein [Betaproteobacteria bacterium]|nr:ABC transporter substrate-binding protein [Betaproteobacteria bacterium]